MKLTDKIIGLELDIHTLNVAYLLNLEWFNSAIENYQKENVTFPSTALRVICMANTEKNKINSMYISSLNRLVLFDLVKRIR